MIRLLMVILAACVLVSAGGCERRDAEEPTGYDANLDGAPGAMQVLVDPQIAANQSALSRAAEAEAPPEPRAGAADSSAKPLDKRVADVMKNLLRRTTR